MRKIYFFVLFGGVSGFCAQGITPTPSPSSSTTISAPSTQTVQNFRTAMTEGFHNPTSTYSWLTGSNLENPLQGQSFDASEVTQKLKPNCKTPSVSVSSK